ncbi:unnamed protein product [Thelazia callipaeda]|uniref:Uracil phosphoribosyltransferase n=1 Tax=Thelazia callipaeda TaxID=103827 RepID=A0A0N5D9U3_THECL|nr:unnamed protein product [Thelazia callipaeda]
MISSLSSDNFAELHQPDIKLILTISTTVQEPPDLLLLDLPLPNPIEPIRHCFVHTSLHNAVAQSKLKSISSKTDFLIFRGKNIKVSILTAETMSREFTIEQSLSKWKETIDFLDTHQIIAIQIPASIFINVCAPRKFRKVFGIEPLTLSLYGPDRDITVGETYHSNTGLLRKMNETRMLYIIIGFLK